MDGWVLKWIVWFAFAPLLSACMVPGPSDFKRQLLLPICKISCVNSSTESIDKVVWGEDELGKLICHARPSDFSGSEANAACIQTQDAHCEFARIKVEKELPTSTCEISESSLYSVCYTVHEHELERGKLDGGSLGSRPDNFPECDSVIQYD